MRYKVHSKRRITHDDYGVKDDKKRFAAAVGSSHRTLSICKATSLAQSINQSIDRSNRKYLTCVQKLAGSQFSSSRVPN